MKFVSLLLASVSIGLSGVSGASAQAAPGFDAPKTSWGAPDLGGTWTNASLTELQRPKEATKLVVSEAEAIEVLRNNRYTLVNADEAAPSKVDEESSRKLLADANPNRGYNAFWMEPGTSLAKVKGEIRTSWIVDPPSGAIPYQTGKRPAPNAYMDFGGPEVRPLNERCVAYGRVGPVLGNGMYNNTIQLVQTPTHFTILAEMIHELRVIPIFQSASEAKHGPAEIRKWGGDSVAWYEGDTLVAETVNTHPTERSFISATGKVTERFTRWNADEILYEFIVDDPSLYTQPWKGEMPLRASADQMYEYACHEGNYGLHGILAGARKLEADGRPQPEVKAIFAGLGDIE